MKRVMDRSIGLGTGGQAMVEYIVVIAGTVVVGFIGFNAPMIAALNDYYKLIVTIVSLPIP